MDVTAIAYAFIGAQASQQQSAMAAKMVRVNADAAASIVKVIEAAQQNLDRLTNRLPSVGTSLDVLV
jgi:hypothetical protein